MNGEKVCIDYDGMARDMLVTAGLGATGGFLLKYGYDAFRGLGPALLSKGSNAGRRLGLQGALTADDALVAEITFNRRQLQHSFKHAGDFGIPGNSNNSSLSSFSSAIQQHITARGTLAISGTYRGQPVTHFFNPRTGVNVIRSRTGEFISGWRLSAKQIQYVITTGRLGGGR